MIAQACGARIDQMDSAWWMPSIAMAPGVPTITMCERALPGSLIVDASARRYMNEAQSYMAAGKAMIEHGATNTQHWLITDNHFMRRYLLRVFGSARRRRELVAQGLLLQADTIAQLARLCSLDEASLQRTLTRFNGFARDGHDTDFGRGNSPYDRYWADPAHRPNPSLRALDHPSFWAMPIHPGDLGTNGGLTTDAQARVLGPHGPIKGLYGAGNVFARSYPGAGATLAAAATFAYVAARDAALSRS